MIQKPEDIYWQMDTADSHEQAIAILEDYCMSIIDECAGNFECEMEDRQQDADDKEQIPVLLRASVLKVKEQLI